MKDVPLTSAAEGRSLLQLCFWNIIGSAGASADPYKHSLGSLKHKFVTSRRDWTMRRNKMTHQPVGQIWSCRVREYISWCYSFYGWVRRNFILADLIASVASRRCVHNALPLTAGSKNMIFWRWWLHPSPPIEASADYHIRAH